MRPHCAAVDDLTFCSRRERARERRALPPPRRLFLCLSALSLCFSCRQSSTVHLSVAAFCRSMSSKASARVRCSSPPLSLFLTHMHPYIHTHTHTHTHTHSLSLPLSFSLSPSWCECACAHVIGDLCAQPTLSGQRIRTRKRGATTLCRWLACRHPHALGTDEREKYEPEVFRDEILEGLKEAKFDYEQVHPPARPGVRAMLIRLWAGVQVPRRRWPEARFPPIWRCAL
jgi:hypothetical protein